MMLKTNEMLLALLVGWNAALASGETPAMPVEKAHGYLSTGKNCSGALKLALPDKVFYSESVAYTPFARTANAEEGITIDLSRLDQVTPWSNLSTVTIGPGNRCANVYMQLDDPEIAIGGGRVGTIGAGGLTVEGGLSLFPFRYGFVCDNVVRYKVVLPCGSLVNATQHSYSDLWLALKCGSNNFGIVTAYESTAFKQGKFCNLEHTAGNIADPPVFKNFTSLPRTISTMRVSNLTDFTLELAGTPSTNRRQFSATGTPPQEPLNISQMTYSLSFQLLPMAMTSKAASRGGNSLGLSEADGNLYDLLLTVSWDSVDDDERIEQHAKDLFQQSEDEAKKLGLYHKYLYLNYAAPWQDPLSGYGDEQKAKLQEVSMKYDPKGLFQKQVSGGFKLFD
ncbi:hypothetical protein MBLNU13_g06880t1 [Cladosporium sp. NU13]